MKMEEGKKTQEKMANETRTKNKERKKAAYEENQKRLEQAQKINFRKNTFEKYKEKFLKKYNSIEGTRLPGHRRHKNRQDLGPRRVNSDLVNTISDLTK